jgi:hypothetical protein
MKNQHNTHMNLGLAKHDFMEKNPFFDPKIPAVQRIGPHRYEIYSIFYGTLLGDAHAEKHGHGTRIFFKQSSKNIKYLHWLHKNVSQFGYCHPKVPKMSKHIGKQNQIYYNLQFHTWTFSSLNEFHENWYSEKRKILPANIQDFLNPISLAYMIMNDGNFTDNGVQIATDCFTKNEVFRLKESIEKTFHIHVNIHCPHKKYYRLYIPKRSFKLLVPIVKPYFCNSILYKLGQ